MERLIYNNVTALPVSKGRMKRIHIDRSLEQGLKNGLIVVYAGAGYGKTQAVSSFLHKSNAAVIWMQMSNLDNLTARFWGGFCYAVSCYAKTLAGHLQELGFPDSLAKFNEFLHLLSDEVYAYGQWVFVLDDFHLIDEQQIIWFIENLVSAQLEKFCTILITRETLQGGIPKITESSIASFVTVEELRFSYEETCQYLKMLNLPLNSGEVEILYDVTEGWPLAIYLFGLSLRKGNLKQGLENTVSVIYQLMDQEIFKLYSTSIQKMLVKLSLIEEYPSDLVACVAGNSEIMRMVEKRNQFITYNAYTDTYQFHNMFLEFLSLRVDMLTEDEKNETYRQMANWYEQHGQPIDAILYYLKAEAYETCWTLIRHSGIEQCTRGEAEILLAVINSFPDEWEKTTPLAKIVKANLYINNYWLQEAWEMLDQLLVWLEENPDAVNHDALIGEVYILKGLIRWYQKELDFPRYFQDASQYLPNGSIHCDYSKKLADSNYAAAMRTPMRGELRLMEQAAFKGIPCISKMMHGFAYGMEYISAAEGSYYTGELRQAASYAQQAIYRGLEQQRPGILCQGYFVMIRVSMAEGNLKGISEYSEKLKQYTKQAANTRPYPLIADIAQGWLCCKLGRVDRVARWIVDETLNDKMLPPYSAGRDRIVRSQYLLYENRFDELLAYLDSSDSLFLVRRNWLALLASKIMQSIASYYTREHENAVLRFREAYEISSGNGLDMAFIEYGTYMRTLAEGLLKAGGTGVPEQWLQNIWKKSSTYAKRASYIISEYQKKRKLLTPESFGLTRREKEILGDLCQGLTRDEIALSRDISVNTVKSMLQGIYGKLGAVNLADAVRIAVSLRLVE